MKAKTETFVNPFSTPERKIIFLPYYHGKGFLEDIKIKLQV